MAQNASEPPGELQAIDKARSRMRLWLTLPLVVLAVGVVGVPLRALVIPTLIILVVLAKGAAEYRALGKRRMQLLDGSS